MWARALSALAAVVLGGYASLSWTSTALAAGPYGSIHVGIWNGGAYTNDSTGAFSHCVASSAFPNGVALLIGQNSGRAWLLGFAHPAWGMRVGETFPIQLIFD